MTSSTTRHGWTVAQLALAGHEHVLEIGCGHGVALAHVCAQLTGGRAVGVDRSAKMIAAAAKRNAAAVAAGTLRLVEGEVQSVALPRAVDVAFALNVALFFHEGAALSAGSVGAACAAVRDALVPKGRFVVVMEPPPGRAHVSLAPCARTLAAHGFVVNEERRATLGNTRVGAVVATRA